MKIKLMLLLGFFFCFNSYPAAHCSAFETPWDVERLFQSPQWEKNQVAAKPGMTGLLYDAIPVGDKRVQVFAYYSAPKGTPPEGGWPAVVCVHGGGGTAFDAWVTKWNNHGYAAISMDLEGHYPIRRTADDRRGPRLPTESPGLSRLGVFQNYQDPIEEQWYFHAVALVIQAHSLLRSFPEVNADKIGMTGISWGGTLTSTIMGVDSRFKFAIPVYGCGFLPDSDGHQGLAIKPGTQSDFVNANFDGSAFFKNVTIPTFWVNGTNDKHFPMPSTQQSAQAVKGPTTIRIELEMKHGHGPGWRPAEIYAFADSIVKDASPLAKISQPEIEGNQVTASFSSALKVTKAELLFTRDSDLWPKRKWETAPAMVSDSKVSSAVPEGATALFFNLTDERKLMVSSEFIELTSHDTGAVESSKNKDTSSVQTKDHYPKFSWDKVPVGFHFGKQGKLMTADEAKFVASHGSFICLEKAHASRQFKFTEDAIEQEAQQLKKINPDLKVIFYWNTFLDYPMFRAHQNYQRHPDWWLKTTDGTLDKKKGSL
jgi:cephalosporin-C deacetylase-like acetyl esterase